jgi:hypothetical protein
VATKNTTRVSGEDPTQDAAGVASAVFPGSGTGQRPAAVTFVDEHDWRGGVAAASLMAAPLRTPILLTDGNHVPGVTSDALDRLRPTGTPYAGRAQAFPIGAAGAPTNLRSRRITGRNPFQLAAAVDSFRAAVSGRPSRSVLVAPAEEPRFAMPAAAWAARSGDAVLFTARNVLPDETHRAIASHGRPGIYVLGPKAVISEAVVKQLQRLGPVTRIAGPDPVRNAIAFARYSDSSFGWGVQDPGHGLVIANWHRPLDGPAAAALSGSGTYGPLLLVDSPKTLPAPLAQYLLDIQPGFRRDPVRGVYNHAWLIGDESAISVPVQTKIDELTEIVPIARKQGQ